jgi:hypothetical protein
LTAILDKLEPQTREKSPWRLAAGDGHEDSKAETDGRSDPGPAERPQDLTASTRIGRLGAVTGIFWQLHGQP